MSFPHDASFDASSKVSADNSAVSSILSDHAMDIAATAGGGMLGGLTGWGTSAAYGGIQRAGLLLSKPGMIVGAALSQGGEGAVQALEFTNAEILGTYAAQEARVLPSVAIGALLGAAIVYGGYRWLTDDSKVHKA
jgi:hypothetical protein